MRNKIKKFKKSRFFKFIARHKYPILLILLAIITHWQWFDPNSLLFHGDWRNWPNENIQRFISGGYGAYVDDLNFGIQNIQIYFSFIFFLWGIIGSYLMATKLVMLLPIALLSLLAPYYLVKELVKDERIAFVAALFYGFTTVLLKLELAHLFIAFVFALAPLIILSFIKLLNNFTCKNILAFSLLFSLGCFYELRIMYIITFIIFFYLLIYITKKKFKVNFFKYILLALVILALNAFWLLPTVFSDRTVLNSIEDRGLFGNNFFNIFYAFSDFDKYWNGQVLIPFEAQPIPSWTWIMPIFIFSLFFFFNKISKTDKKIILFSFFLALLGILLSKQSFEPWPDLYAWLYKNFPGFSLFREASKFFLIITLGYLLLFAYALKYIIIKNKRFNKHFKSAIFILFSIIFLWQAKPLITGEVGWLFSPKIEPGEYKILNQIIKSGNDFYRTLWIPRDSQWGFYNWDKPKVSLVSVKDSEYKTFYSEHKAEKNYADFIFEPLEKNYGNYLADLSNIKYFVIPMPDWQSDVYEYYGSAYQDYIDKIKNLDFLTELKIDGLDKIKLYENKGYKPYIFAFDSLFAVSANQNLEKKFNLINNYLNKDFNFTLLSNGDKEIENLTGLENLFENINFGNIKLDELIFTADSSINQKNNFLLTNKFKNNLYAKKENSIILFYTKPSGSLNFNGRLISQEQTNILEQIKVEDAIEYYVSQNSNLTPLIPNVEISLGQFDRTASLTLFSETKQNLIVNPSFEQGLWQDKAKDCHNYDNNPILNINLNNQEKTQGNYSLQLEATKHTACTSTQFSVEPEADFIFSFDYKNLKGQKVGYYLEFNNPQKTIINESFINNENDWQVYRKWITTPQNATSAKLYLYAFESDEMNNNINLYDNLQFLKINQLKSWEIQGNSKEYNRENLILTEEKNVFSYSSKNLNYQNIIKNSSFEDGLWQKKVKDCHNYDDNPILAMSQNNQEKTEGDYSLQLEATRHDACSSVNFPIKENSTYFFSFDYQSPNAESVGYYLSFNSPQKDYLSDKIKLNNQDWQNFNKIITTPEGATQANLYIYAYATNNGKNNITRYDHFQFIEITDLTDKYYLISLPKFKIQEPKKIEFENIGPIKKEINIKSASAPFFLALNESYNPYWQLEFNGQENQGILNSWWPFAKPQKISEKNHYRLDSFLNAWYVDIYKLCRNNQACAKNADGSYDIKMTVEFWPQRWFYLGALISFVVSISMILFYIIFYKFIWLKK
ncbi:MAG: hypothetical protein NTZ49_00045 [Candidatus Parcubacteria bacterium]|nr:hypothetical protein [Candidatus Parcubacteria bacterium]